MNTRPTHLALVLVAMAPLAGCATVSPPPAAMALEGASQTPVGSTSITGFGGLAGGVWIDGAAGGGARLAHRFSREISAGVDGVAGGTLQANHEQAAPRALYAGRAHLQANPEGSEHIAFTVGGGGGVGDNRLAYVTVDASVRVSGRVVHRMLEPYVAGVVSLSVPTDVPSGAILDGGTDRRILTTFWGGIDAGLVYHPTPRLDLVVDVLALGGYSAANNTLLLVPTAGLRYAFGGDATTR